MKLKAKITYTPGQWKAVKNSSWSSDHIRVFGDRTGYLICTGPELTAHATAIAMPFENQSTIDGNAALIAAAPDMLKALQNLENDDNSIPDHAWKLVQDAITKATTKP
jgi:hypothetical protein